MSHRLDRCFLALATGALSLAACGESPTAVTDRPSPDHPSFAISDGAHSGNEGFYFLPSIAPKTDYPGTFDGSLAPEVEICVWDGVTCTVTLALFNMDAGYGSETVRVSEADEHYIVHWHAREILDDYPLGPGETYRIRVLVEDQELGFADVAVFSTGRQRRNVDRDEFVPLKDGGTLAIKFRIEEGALVEAAGEQPSAGLSAGLTHSCAVASDGRAYCWGANHRGQLGTGSAGGTFDTPQLVTGGLSWQAVQASRVFTCGLATDGRIYCWGSNTLGELGLGSVDFDTHPVPVPVAGGLTFRSLASLGDRNSSSTCGVTTDGDMYCWGANGSGQLGTGTITHDEPAPSLVTGGHEFSGPAALARRFTCGMTTADEILCWGVNDFGQLGRGFSSSFSSPEPMPGPVLGGHTFVSIAAGAMHACGIDETSAAWCWGRNQDGELGIGTVGGAFSVPQPVSGGHTFAQLTGGWGFACGVDAAGEGLCWGANQYGQLGRGFTSSGDHPTPGPISGSHTFTSIDAGRQHACGLATTGEIYCWGIGSSGQLGTGSTSSSPTPQLAMDLDPESSP